MSKIDTKLTEAMKSMEYMFGVMDDYSEPKQEHVYEKVKYVYAVPVMCDGTEVIKLTCNVTCEIETLVGNKNNTAYCDFVVLNPMQPKVCLDTFPLCHTVFEISMVYGNTKRTNRIIFLGYDKDVKKRFYELYELIGTGFNFEGELDTSKIVIEMNISGKDENEKAKVCEYLKTMFS